MKKIFILFCLLNVSMAFTTDRTILVRGVGTISLDPDTVVISTGIDSADPDIGQALMQNTNSMEILVAGLVELGIPKKNIKTTSYNVYLFKPYLEDSKEREEYRISNSINININNIEIVDTVLDSLITLGANKINGIVFTVSNPNNYREKLLTLALEDARNKAEILANAEGLRILEVISIKEDGVQSTPEFGLRMADSYGKGGISMGLEEISEGFTVMYKIGSK